MELSGKKAVVFGGTSGIGASVTDQLLTAGATVVAISRNPDMAARDGLTILSADVTDDASVASVLQECAPFDILVSTATGGGRAMGPFEEMDFDAFQGSFAKFFGYSRVVKLGLPHLVQDGVITLVSGSPARRPKAGQIALSSVGGAVEQFVRALAPEIAPRRINVVAPGIIDTPMFGPDVEARANMLGGASANHIIPRAGHPDEVAQAVLFTLTNDFVTGTTIDVDGGWVHSY
jgi:NAD(P)-dependent dehydrogenase (short-subunit alcohol dehydrogenase family)